jgi:hypothetical protein
MRVIDQAALDLAEAGGGAIRLLATVTIGESVSRYIDEPAHGLELATPDGTYIYDSVDPRGFAFSGVPAGGGMTAERFAITVDGTALLKAEAGESPDELLSSFYDEDYENAEIDLQFAIFSSAPGQFVTTLDAISGRIVSAPLSISGSDGRAVLQLNCQTMGQDYNLRNAGTRSAAHFRGIYADDEGGDLIGLAVNDRSSKWGLGGATTNRASNGGGTGGGGSVTRFQR